MQFFKKQSKISSLVSRLRDLEAEALRLAASDVPSDRLPIKNLYKDRLNSLENAHSHSWFGDHSSTYFMGFQTPPPGQSFDVEWGFIPGFHGRRNRDWQIYSRDEIRAFLSHDIGEDIHYELNALAEKLVKDLSDLRDQSLDVLEALSHQIKTEALTRYATRVKSELVPYKIVDFINSKSKSAPKVTRDSEEIMKGQIVPAHIQFLASFSSIAANKSKLQDLANILRNTIQATTLHKSEPSGGDVPNKIFIGHGKSEQWRILKDFLGDRLNLPYEEFNRISAAGINTQERLSEMLDECGFAFLVLAAEDLHGDGSLHARENVIHRIWVVSRPSRLEKSNHRARRRMRGIFEHRWSRSNPLFNG